MDSLRASYKDDEVTTLSGQPQTEEKRTAMNGCGLSECPSNADQNSRDEATVGIHDKEAALVAEYLSSDEVSEEINEKGNKYPKPLNDASNSSNSPNTPNFTRLSDTEEDEEEEEPAPKKQRQLSSLTSPSPENPQKSGDVGGSVRLPSPSTPAAVAGEALNPSLPTTTAAKPSSKSSKKSKKKNNNVWTRPTSRKGKKKAKANCNSNGIQTSTPGELEDKVLITPTPRFPDKNDDSQDAKICLSKVNKAEKVELSDDRMSAGSSKGYRMVRATRGVVEGAWYFEIKIMHLGESGHTRLGWSTDKGDLQAPVGYDANSFGYRDIDGTKLHKAVREKYGDEGYKEGDVIGFYINLPDGSLYTPKHPRWVWYKGQKFVFAPDAKDDPPKVVPGSEISFFKNGVCQGTAFSDLFGGRYFPAASMYTLPNQPNCTVKFNFGPDFEFFLDDFGGRAVPRPMIEVPYHGIDARVENGCAWYPHQNVFRVQCLLIIEMVEAHEK